jgi:hypothetical protein
MDDEKVLTLGKVIDLEATVPGDRLVEQVQNYLNNGWTLSPEARIRLERDRIDVENASAQPSL